MNRQELVSLLREQELNLIPLQSHKKIPSVKWSEYQSKKYTEQISDDANIGVICGLVSGNLVVIDIDSKDESIIDVVLPDARNRTMVVKTARGFHIYIKTERMPKTLRLENGSHHIDVQSTGTYVVGPLSIHPDGTTYEVISNTTTVKNIDFQIVIQNLEKLGFTPTQDTLTIKEIKKNGVNEGNRNDSMFKAACDLLQEQKLDEPIAWAYLQTINEKNKPPLDEEELKTIFESAKKYNKDKPEESKEDSTLLYELAMSKIKKLVISQNNSNEVYAVIENNGHNETINLSNKRAIQWLNYTCHNNGLNKIHGEEFYKNVLTTIVSHAHLNGTKREKIYNRVAMIGDTIYYDLCSPDWNIIKITSGKIALIPFDQSMPLFRRSQSSIEQVKPVFDCTQALDDLVNLLRVKNKQLFKVHLVALTLEDVPVPIMLFDGEAGSMKTTLTAAVKRIIDPNGISSEDNCSSMPTKSDDLIIHLYHRHVSAFDNVTRVSQETSDILCRAVTGACNSKRELYTNSEETILNMKGKVVLNGIVPSLEYPDLQDRIISYERTPLEENERLTDQDFQDRFAKLLPYVIGQIFTVLQKAIANYPTVKQAIKPKTRLADFEVWGESISRALEYEPHTFIEKYCAKRASRFVSNKDTYPIILAIESLMKDRLEYEDTATRCLKILAQKADEHGIERQSKYVKFPRAPNQLVRELTIVSPILKSLGIKVETSNYTKNDGKYTKNSKIVRIAKTDSIVPTDLPSSPVSTLENYIQKDTTAGESIGENATTTSSPQDMSKISQDKNGERGEENNQSSVSKFICETCNTQPINLNDPPNPKGNYLDYHRLQGHQISYLN
jgi:hypothetical protein